MPGQGSTTQPWNAASFGPNPPWGPYPDLPPYWMSSLPAGLLNSSPQPQQNSLPQAPQLQQSGGNAVGGNALPQIQKFGGNPSNWQSPWGGQQSTAAYPAMKPPVQGPLPPQGGVGPPAAMGASQWAPPGGWTPEIQAAFIKAGRDPVMGPIAGPWAGAGGLLNGPQHAGKGF